MLKIKVRGGESLEAALRRFNREVQKSGILEELRERERFEKPSEIKRRRNKEIARRIYLDKMR